jgi:signal transduction histidine kinase
VAQRLDDPKLLEGLQGALDKTLRRRTTVEVDRGQQQRGGVLRFTVRPARESDAARAVMIIEDITQQRVAERARYAFVAHATHELRTPLTNIRLYVESLVDEPDASPAERGQRLNVINQEVRRLENLVGDMLSVAEIESGAMRADRDDVPMAAIFETLHKDYQQQAADKSITLHFDLPPKLPTLQGDRAKLVQALHNLVGNAIKYTPEGGEVRVKAEWAKGQLVVDVADSGIGIGEEDLANLFQKFYRARDERVSKITGSGLGLALSREIVRLHGGEITVQSQLNKGSTFTVNLPATAQAA